MASNIEVILGIKADASQARAEIQSLGRSLANIASNTPRFSKDFDMKNAINDAKELQSILLKSFNTDTGQLDLSKFSNQLTRSGKTLDDYRRSFNKLGTDGSQAFSQLTSSIAKADAPIVSLGSKITKMGESLKKAIGWQISSSVIHGIMGAYQQAFGYAEDLNKSLTNIQIVSGQSKEQMAQFAQEANKAAQALSTTTTAYTDAALIFYQQGLNKDEVAERTEATIKMSQVTGDNATEVSSYMTAIWNNFDNGSQKLSYFSDVITALGASTASSSSEIAEGLSKFAAIGETVGLSYEYATSSLATIVAATRQSADTVGTALKTIFSRMQGLKLGETLDDETDLNKYSKALSDVGISIKDSNGELKDMDNIIDEMGAKWKELSKDQKMALAQTVAGTRQYTQLISLMDNYDKFKENVETARGSEGTVERQAEVYEKSWEAAQKRVQASMESIYMTLINDDFFIKLNDAIAEALKGVKGLIEGFGGVKGIILQAGGIFATMFAKKIPEVTEKLRDNFRIITGRAKKDTSNLQAQAAQQESLNSKEFLAKGDYTRAAESAGLARVADMKAKLTNATNRLSESEKREYQQQIALMELRAKNLQETAEAATQKNKEINNSQKRMNNLIYQKSIDVNNAEDNGAEYGIRMGELLDDEYLKKVFKNSDSKIKVSQIIEDQLKDSFSQISQIKDFTRTDLSENMSAYMAKESSRSQAEIVSKMVASFRTEAQKQQKIAGSAHLLNKELAQSGASLLDKGKNGGFTDASAYKKEVQSLMISLKSMADKGGKPFKQIADDIDKMSQKINDISTDDAQAAIDDLNAKIEELLSQDISGSVTNKIQNIEENAEEQNRDLTQAEGMIVGASPEQITESVNAVANSGQIYAEAEQELNSFNEAQAEVPIHTMGISEALTMATGTMISMVGSVQAVSNCIKTLGDEEATATEKIGAFLGAAMSVLSTFAQMTNQITMMRTSQIGATVATNAQTGATMAQAGATTAATTAQHGLNAAMKANPIGFVIMGIETLITVITIFITVCGNMKSAYQSAVESFEDSSKKLSETREELKDLDDKIETTQERINELKSQGPLNLIEQQELEKLERTNELLEQQRKVKAGIENSREILNVQNAENLLNAQGTVETYGTVDWGNNISEKFWQDQGVNLEQKDAIPFAGGLEYLWSRIVEQKDTYGQTIEIKGTLEEQIIGLTKFANQQQKELEEKIASGWDNSNGIQEWQNNIDIMTTLIDEKTNLLQNIANAFIDEEGNIISGQEENYAKAIAQLQNVATFNDKVKQGQLELEKIVETSGIKNINTIKSFISSFGSSDEIINKLPESVKNALDNAAKIAKKSNLEIFKDMDIEEIKNHILGTINDSVNAIKVDQSLIDRLLNGDKAFTNASVRNTIQNWYDEYQSIVGQDDFTTNKELQGKAEDLYKKIHIVYDIQGDGDFNITLGDIEDKFVNSRIEEYQKNIDKLNESINKYKERISGLNTAISESNSGSISDDSIDIIKESIYNLGDEILSTTEKQELFDKTIISSINGIKVNAEAVAKLKQAMANSEGQKLEEQLTAIKNRAKEVTAQMEELRRGGLIGSEYGQYQALQSELESLEIQIQDIEIIKGKWDAATSAYQKYKDILSGGNSSDQFSELGKGAVKAAQEAIDKGFTDSAEVNSFFTAMYGDDWEIRFTKDAEKAGISVAEAGMKAFKDKSIMTFKDGNIMSLSDVWHYNDDGELDTQGLWNFLQGFSDNADKINEMSSAADKLGRELIKVGKDGSISFNDLNEEAINFLASDFFKGNLDPKALEMIFSAMGDIKEIELDLSTIEIERDWAKNNTEISDTIEKLKEAKIISKDTAKEITKVLSGGEIKDGEQVKKKIGEISNLIKELTPKDKNGNIVKINVDDESFNIIQALAAKKLELEKPVLMKINLDNTESEDGMEKVSQLIDAVQKFSVIKAQIDAGLNIEGAKEQLNTLGEQITTLANDSEITQLNLGIQLTDDSGQAVEPSAIAEQISNGLNVNKDNQLTLQVNETGSEVVIAKLDEIKQKAEEEEQKKIQYVVTRDDFTPIYNKLTDMPDTTTKNVNITTTETTIKVTKEGKTSGADGKSGPSKAIGDARVKGNGTALGGEEGPEIVVRDGKWFTIGDNGPEFFHYEEDDLIFNAKQTNDLLSMGHTSSYAQGQSFAEGLAFNNSDRKNYLTADPGKHYNPNAGGTNSAGETYMSHPSNDGDKEKSSKDKDNKSNKTKTSTKDKKKYKEEIERYHEINDTIDNLNKKLDITASKKELAFGSKQTNLLQKENEQLKQSIKNYDALTAEAKKYLNIDKKLLEKKYGAKIDKDTGVITNYEEIVKQQVDQYNAAVEAYNKAAKAYDAASDDDKDSLKENLDKLGEEVDKANKKYEEFKKNISNYEESNDKYLDAQKQKLEAQAKLVQNWIDSIETELEIKIKLDDHALKFIDYQLEKSKEDAYNIGETINNLGRKGKLQNDIAETNISEANQELALYQDKNGKSYTVADFEGMSTKQQKKLLESLTSKEKVDENGDPITMTDDMVNAILGNIEDGLGALNDLRQTYHDIFDSVDTFFETYKNDLDSVEDSIDKSNGIIKTYEDMVDIVGKEKLGFTNELLESWDDAVLQSSIDKLGIAKKELADIKTEYKYALGELAKAQTDNDKEMIYHWSETVKKLKQQVEESEQELADSWTEALQYAADAFERKINAAVETFEKSIAGANQSLSGLHKIYDRQKEIDKRYLEDYRQIYELSKLTRSITNSIDETDNLATKESLRDLQEEINQISNEDVKLSEYDLEVLQKRFELEQARANWQDAQTAKTQVRMVRDNEGNFGYVYTADDNAVQDAQQAYEDRLYELQKLNSEHIEEIENMTLQLNETFIAEMQEIYSDSTLTTEARKEQIESLKEWYQQLLDFYTEQENNTLENNRHLWEIEWKEYSDKTGYKISADENYADKYEETTLAIISKTNSLQERQQQYMEAAQKLFEETGKAYQEYGEVVASVNEVMTENTGDAASTINEIITGDDGIVEAMNDTIDSVNELEEKWDIAFSKIEKRVSSAVTLIGNKIKELEKLLGIAEEKTQKETNKTKTKSGDTTKDNGDSSGDGDNSSKDGGKTSKNNKTWTQLSKDQRNYLVAAIWNGNYGWSNDPYRNGYLQEAGFSDADAKAVQQAVNTWNPNANNKWNEDIYHKKANVQMYQRKNFDLAKFDTGGYTGNWGTKEGKFAMLHQKELILNQDDTQNLLGAVEVVRNIVSMIDANALSAQVGFGDIFRNIGFDNSQELNQNVTITAEFPNVTDRNEIVEAFETLVNTATQYANRK